MSYGICFFYFAFLCNREIQELDDELLCAVIESTQTPSKQTKSVIYDRLAHNLSKNVLDELQRLQNYSNEEVNLLLAIMTTA